MQRNSETEIDKLIAMTINSLLSVQLWQKKVRQMCDTVVAFRLNFMITEYWGQSYNSLKLTIKLLKLMNNLN